MRILATIETIELIRTKNGLSKSLGVWEVTDKFDALSYRISYSFPDVRYYIPFIILLGL